MNSKYFKMINNTSYPNIITHNGSKFLYFNNYYLCYQYVTMTYKVTEEGNISTVFLNGEIDMDVTEKAKEVILPLVESGKEVHLNLKDVSYMDSSGISVLIESHQKALEKNTKVIIKEVSKSVLKVIMMAKLEQILNLG